MDRLVSTLRREPVRVRLYALAGLTLGYLVARGLIDPSDAEFLGSAALIVFGVESARSKVSPV